jgi:hypothetical protein
MGRKLFRPFLLICTWPLLGLALFWGLAQEGPDAHPVALAAGELTSSVTPTPPLRSRTPVTTPVPSPTPYLSVTVEVTPARYLMRVGDPLTVTVTIRNESEGCQYPIFDLTLRQ